MKNNKKNTRFLSSIDDLSSNENSKKLGIIESYNKKNKPTIGDRKSVV